MRNSPPPTDRRKDFAMSESIHRLSSLTFSRTWLLEVAKENHDIAKSGSYTNSKGETIDIKEALQSSIQNTVLYNHDQELTPPNKAILYETKLSVCYSLCMKAALAMNKAGSHVGVLNSANGTTPGGSYLTGTRSLESCICRASLLYPTLEPHAKDSNSMYQINASGDFHEAVSSSAIFSPHVPIIRKDALEAHLLDQYSTAYFVSLPAPNAFSLAKDLADDETRTCRTRIEDALYQHISRALLILSIQNCTDLVLCTYGCGSKGNNPKMVARIYKEVLDGPCRGHFKRIIFAINPKKEAEYDAFAEVFES